MYNELEFMYKEMVVAYLEILFLYFHRLRKTTKILVRIAGFRAEMLTQDLPNTNTRR